MIDRPPTVSKPGVMSRPPAPVSMRHAMTGRPLQAPFGHGCAIRTREGMRRA
jgi:hypothetical protein